MGYATALQLVHAPAAQVWQALNDIAHTHEWVQGLARAEIVTPGDYGEGSVYIDYNRLGPFLQKTPWHVTVFSPTTRQVHVSQSSLIPSTLTLELSPHADGTQLQMHMDYRFLPRLGPLSRWLEGAVMNRLIRRVIAQNLRNLDAYLRRELR